MGNNAPTANPAFIASCSTVNPKLSANVSAEGAAETVSVMTPTSCGPTDAPISPPAAIIAYINKPPSATRSDETIKLPGQSIETQSPVSAQAISPTTAQGENTAIR